MPKILSALPIPTKPRLESITIDLGQSPLAKPAADQLYAGVAEVDITPLPGVPKGGYSAMSRTGVGFRTRLKSRVFYIRPAQGESICILQADLHAGSAIIRNKVAELVAAKTDLIAANLCLTCTHTHSGPGQLLESNFYNRFASHKPGFDVTLFEEISQRIAGAVIQAYEQAKPAKMASGVTEIYGLTRNRSIPPYLNNANVYGNARDQDLKYQAINPRFHLLRIDLLADDGRYYPAGAFSNFSIHGTCIPANSDVFAADSWAYIARGLARWIEQAYHTPWQVIHGPSQGTHGDIAPDVQDKSIGFPEAKRIGEAVAEKAKQLYQELDDAMEENLLVRNGLRLVDLYREPTIADITIASHPMIGTALTAGAYEHSTPVVYHLPLFKHGMGSARLFSADPEQGRKRKVGGNLQKLLLPKQDFPHEILLQTLQVGNFVLVGVPFEVTVEAGREIEHLVKQALGERQGQVCVASLCNGYTGYTTTAAEYEKQYYEGGHTLYGPNSNRFIAEHCKQLMTDTLVRGSVADIPTEWHYQMQCHDYMAQPGIRPSGAELAWQSRPRWVAATSGKPGSESYWCAHFTGPAPEDLAWHHPIVVLETSDSGVWQPLLDHLGSPVDDNGEDIEIRYQKGRYEVRCYFECWSDMELRFRFRQPGSEQVMSDSFCTH